MSPSRETEDVWRAHARSIAKKYALGMRGNDLGLGEERALRLTRLQSRTVGHSLESARGGAMMFAVAAAA